MQKRGMKSGFLPVVGCAIVGSQRGIRIVPMQQCAGQLSLCRRLITFSHVNHVCCRRGMEMREVGFCGFLSKPTLYLHFTYVQYHYFGNCVRESSVPSLGKNGLPAYLGVPRPPIPVRLSQDGCPRMDGPEVQPPLSRIAEGSSFWKAGIRGTWRYLPRARRRSPQNWGPSTGRCFPAKSDKSTRNDPSTGSETTQSERENETSPQFTDRLPARQGKATFRPLLIVLYPCDRARKAVDKHVDSSKPWVRKAA